MDVYADLLFLINFFMDYACLKISAKAGGFTLKRRSGVMASAVGGIYSIASLFVENRIVSFLLSLLFPIFMCAIAFLRRGDSIKRLMKISLVFFLVSTLSGGGVSLAFYFFERVFFEVGESALPKSGFVLSPAVCLSLSLGCFVSYLAVILIKKANIDKAEQIRIEAHGRGIILRVIADSGNKLCDPFSGKACTVISLTDLCLLVGEEKGKRMAGGESFPCEKIMMRAIPVRTVSGSALMFGFLPDRAVLLDCSGKELKAADTLIVIGKEGIPSGKAILPTSLL